MIKSVTDPGVKKENTWLAGGFCFKEKFDYMIE